jgi:predicted nuclease of predicted toxin-antitoxin system
VKFLADENIHADIVAWLRSEGHDVAYAAETLTQRADDELLAIARDDARVLITDDKDFGELVFHRKLVSRGVVLIRLENARVADRLQRLAQVWPDIEAQAEDKFIVVSEHKVRVRGVLRST